MNKKLTGQLNVDLKILEYIIDDFKDDLNEIKIKVNTTQSNTQEIKTTSASLVEDTKLLWAELTEVRGKQADCHARHNVKSINARLKKLEDRSWNLVTDRQDQTGGIILPSQQPTPTMPQDSLAMFISKNLKIILLIILALMTGVAFSALLFTGNIVPVVP